MRPFDGLRIGVLLLAVGGVATGTLAFGEPVEVSPRTGSNFDWLEKPKGADIARVFPSRAANLGKSGRAVIKCAVQADGLLTDCLVVAETPDDAGFGLAALKLTPKFRMPATRPDGGSVEGATVIIPILFTMGRSPAPRVNLFPGDISVLLTTIPPGEKSSARDIPCPSSTAPERTCRPHLFGWHRRAAYTHVIEAAKASDQKTGVSHLECSVGADGRLHKCKVGGTTSATAEAALLKLADDFRAPPLASDGEPMSSGRVLIEIDWAAMNRIIPASELKRD